MGIGNRDEIVAVGDGVAGQQTHADAAAVGDPLADRQHHPAAPAAEHHQPGARQAQAQCVRRGKLRVRRVPAADDADRLPLGPAALALQPRQRGGDVDRLGRTRCRARLPGVRVEVEHSSRTVVQQVARAVEVQ